MSMHISQTLQCLIDDISDFQMWDRLLFLQQLINIFIHELKDKVKLIFVFNKLVQIDNVGMVQFDENFDFVQIFALLPVRILLFHLFDCNYLPILFINSLDNTTEAAIPKDLSDFIFLHLNTNQL